LKSIEELKKDTLKINALQTAFEPHPNPSPKERDPKSKKIGYLSIFVGYY
jgi:hypothetical protein